MLRRLVATLAASLGLAFAAAARADSPRGDLRLEAGTEFDSNIHRLERPAEGAGDEDLEGAPLARLGARGRLTWRPAARQRIRLQAQGSTKLFASAGGQSENVAVVAAEGGWERGLGERAATLGVLGGYYDAIGFELYEPERIYQAHNFRLATGEAQLGLTGPGGQRVTAGLGLRAFHYKPEPLFDWVGETATLAWQRTLWRGDPDHDADAAALELQASYRVERRGYDASARTRACPEGADPGTDCFAATRLPRTDLHHRLALEAMWVGQRVYGVRYELEANDSNSFGESLVRHRLELATTVELGRDTFATAEVAVLYNVFLDNLLVARDVQAQSFVSIEDENRNSLSLLVSRKLERRTAVEARYAIYSNEFATEELAFRRQTFYLGLVHEL